MITSVRRHFALSVLVLRAVALHVLVRVTLPLLALTGGPNIPGFNNPIGIVILVTLLGALDFRRRNETMLWRNLAYSSWVTVSIFTLMATIGELLLAVVSRL